jgi:hypothetical protein
LIIFCLFVVDYPTAYLHFRGFAARLIDADSESANPATGIAVPTPFAGPLLTVFAAHHSVATRASLCATRTFLNAAAHREGRLDSTVAFLTSMPCRQSLRSASLPFAR